MELYKVNLASTSRSVDESEWSGFGAGSQVLSEVSSQALVPGSKLRASGNLGAESLTNGGGVQAFVESAGLDESEDSEVTDGEVVAGDEWLITVGVKSLLNVVEEDSGLGSEGGNFLLSAGGGKEVHVEIALPEVTNSLDCPVSPVSLTWGLSVEASLAADEVEDGVALVEVLAIIILPDWNLTVWEDTRGLELSELLLVESNILVGMLGVGKSEADWLGGTVDIEVDELGHCFY